MGFTPGMAQGPSTVTFGVLVPYFNSAVEPELAALRPEGVVHQTARFALGPQVVDDIVGTAEKLRGCGPDALLIAIAPENFPGGLELLRQGSARVREATGLPVHTPSFAAHEALRALGAGTVGIVTPFDEASTAHVVAAYEGEGFRVAASVAMARPALNRIADTPHDEVRRAFARADAPTVEALVQVGTGLPLLPLVDELEARFGKPVLGSNLALYWQALRASGRSQPLAGCGRLLARA